MEDIRVFSYAAGMCETNCYLVQAPGGDILIDTGDDPDGIAEFVRMHDGHPEYILLTHGHFDHILGAPALAKMYNAKVYISGPDAPALRQREVCMVLPYAETPFTPMEPDGLLAPGKMEFCGLTFTVIPTPGHTPGGVALWLEAEKLLFSGDTLFANGYGRTDFAGGSVKDLLASLRTLLALPGDTLVYPGHYNSALLSEIKKGFSL